MALLHVMFGGQTHEIPINLQDSTDEAIKLRVAAHLDVAVTEFDDFEVEHEPTGNLTLRPEAPFGSGASRK